MKTREEQIATLDKIRDASKDHLKMYNWHSPCGTSHCMAGWAQILNDQPTKLTEAQDIGGFLLPDFAKFFYGTTEHISAWLESRAYALAVGEVAKVGDLWITADCNFYDGELTEQEAKDQDATNIHCMYCTRCTVCTR